LSERSNLEIVRTALEAFNRRDFEAALDLMSDDVTWVPFLAKTETPLLRGKDEIREAWARQFDVMDLEVEVERLTASDESRVVSETRMRGRGLGSELAVDAAFVQLVTFRDGLVSSVESFATVEEARAAARSPGLLERSIRDARGHVGHEQPDAR
jgi:ketosteroid isomerase-like protein